MDACPSSGQYGVMVAGHRRRGGPPRTDRAESWPSSRLRTSHRRKSGGVDHQRPASLPVRAQRPGGAQPLEHVRDAARRRLAPVTTPRLPVRTSGQRCVVDDHEPAVPPDGEGACSRSTVHRERPGRRVEERLARCPVRAAQRLPRQGENGAARRPPGAAATCPQSRGVDDRAVGRTAPSGAGRTDVTRHASDESRRCGDAAGGRPAEPGDEPDAHRRRARPCASTPGGEQPVLVAQQCHARHRLGGAMSPRPQARQHGPRRGRRARAAPGGHDPGRAATSCRHTAARPITAPARTRRDPAWDTGSVRDSGRAASAHTPPPIAAETNTPNPVSSVRANASAPSGSAGTPPASRDGTTQGRHSTSTTPAAARAVTPATVRAGQGGGHGDGQGHHPTPRRERCRRRRERQEQQARTQDRVAREQRGRPTAPRRTRAGSAAARAGGARRRTGSTRPVPPPPTAAAGPNLVTRRPAPAPGEDECAAEQERLLGPGGHDGSEQPGQAIQWPAAQLGGASRGGGCRDAPARERRRSRGRAPAPGPRCPGRRDSRQDRRQSAAVAGSSGAPSAGWVTGTGRGPGAVGHSRHPSWQGRSRRHRSL